MSAHSDHRDWQAKRRAIVAEVCDDLCGHLDSVPLDTAAHWVLRQADWHAHHPAVNDVWGAALRAARARLDALAHAGHLIVEKRPRKDIRPGGTERHYRHADRLTPPVDAPPRVRPHAGHGRVRTQACVSCGDPTLFGVDGLATQDLEHVICLRCALHHPDAVNKEEETRE